MLLILLAVLSADAPQQAGPDKEEMKKFHGDWVLSKREHGGKASTAKELAKFRIEVSDKAIKVLEADEDAEDLLVTRLAPKGKPAEIDLKIAAGEELDKEIKGIYKFDAGTLTVCYAEPGKERPKAFEAKMGTGHTLLVLTKAKKK